jgi:hypothetical protein
VTTTRIEKRLTFLVFWGSVGDEEAGWEVGGEVGSGVGGAIGVGEGAGVDGVSIKNPQKIKKFGSCFLLLGQNCSSLE